MTAVESYDRHPEPILFRVGVDEHFDYRSIPTFKNLCNDKLDREALVIVDMARTHYADSSGIALLRCLNHWIRAPRVTVQVINCTPQMRRILSGCRLAENITIN